MNLTPHGKTYLVIVFLSLIISHLLITNRAFPHLGITLSLLLFTVFSYRQKKSKTKITKLYLVLTLLFFFLISVRSEPLITLFNILASLLFGTLMLTEDSYFTGFIHYALSIPNLLIRSLFTKSEYVLELMSNDTEKRTKQTQNILFGVISSVIILAVVLPLLGSANPIFQKILLNLASLFNWNQENLFLLCIRFVIFFTSLLVIPKIITLINKRVNLEIPININWGEFSFNMPKTVLVAVLFVFFVTQLELYFATSEYLASINISYSQRAREVFGQLTVVAGIALALLYNDQNKNKISNILSYILGLQGLFLILMAFKSDFDYINAWGLTYIRLYGLTFATWLTGIFVLFFKNYTSEKPKSLFVKKTIFFSGIILLLVNTLNFDYLIYHYKKASTGQGTDYEYLTRLSGDSLSFKEQYNNITSEIRKAGSINETSIKNPYRLQNKIEMLQVKYRNFDFRTFNLLDYLAYLQVKNIDPSELGRLFSQKT